MGLPRPHSQQAKLKRERLTMIDMEEVKKRVLSELEEAGEEEVTTLLNTVFLPTGDKIEAELVSDALGELAREGLVLVAVANTDRKTWKILEIEDSVSEINRLPEFIHFVSKRRLWTDVRDVGPPYSMFNTPLVVATEQGKSRAFEILDERGYQWWRQKA